MIRLFHVNWTKRLVTEDSVNAWPRCLEDDCQVAFDLELHGTAPNWPRSPEKDRFPTVFLLLSFLDMVNLVMQNLPKKLDVLDICEHL